MPLDLSTFRQGIAAALGRRPWLLPLIVLIALLALDAALVPNFAALEVREGRVYGASIDILQNGAPVMLLAIGMTLVIAIGGIDLSVGSVMALSGAVGALVVTRPGATVAQAVLAALATAGVAGLWNGVLVHFVRLQPIIATLILLVTGRGIAQALTGDQKVRFEAPAFEFIGNGYFMHLPFPLYIVAASALIVLFLLRRTALGLYIEAIGGNARASRLCGLPVGAVRLAVYAFCSLSAGMAGLLAAADIKEADVTNAGLYLELDAILAVVIGGTRLNGGRPLLLGSLIGAVLMQTLTVTLLMQDVRPEHTLLIKALTAIAICCLQSPVFERWVEHSRKPAEGAA